MNMDKTTKPQTLVDLLRKMDVDDQMTFKIYRLTSVRGTISRLKFIYENMKFSCKVNPKVDGEDRTFTVTRTE